MIALEALAAAYGDSLLVECARPGRPPYRILVDGGPPEAWEAVRARLAALPAGERRLDLVIVTHIDSDHIAGAVRLLADDLGLELGDVWFNALAHLPAPAVPAGRSVDEGETLAALLAGAAGRPAVPWNRALDGSAIVTPGDAAYLEIALPDGPRLTLLSPTPRRLAALRRLWVDELERLHRGEGSDEPERTRAAVAPLDDLAALAGTRTTSDRAAPNGSSIVVLVEHGGASCLLGADAHPDVVAAALEALARDRGVDAIAVDAFKLNHHGSRANVTARLLAAAPARTYIVSTSGERFGHPDDVALARVVAGHGTGATLRFNYATARNARWADPALCARYGHAVALPPEDAPGLRVELP